VSTRYQGPANGGAGTALKAASVPGLGEERRNSFAYEWDAVTGVVVLSGGCKQVLGLKEGAHSTGQQVLPNIHPDDAAKLETTFAALTPDNPHTQISYRMLRPKHGDVWVETNGMALFDRAGCKLSITGEVTDITGRNLAQTELVTANALLHLALEAGQSVGWDWDVKSGRDSWFGDLQSVFGIPSTSYSGHVEDFRRRVHADDRALVWKAVTHAMESRSLYRAEFRIVREDGSLCWVAAQGRFYYSSDGDPRRMLGIAVDITARKSAEQALRGKDKELAEAQRLAGVGSWRWDPETDTVVWSEELYRIAGRDPKLPAVSYAEHPRLFTPESWERLRRSVEDALRTGSPYELDLEMIRADGRLRWVTARGEAERDTTGRVVQLRGTVQDITERRRSQEALRESEERLRLAAQAGRMYAFEWDRKSDKIVRSAEFAHILGLSSKPKETTCEQMMTVVHPDDRVKVHAALDGCTPENPTYRVQYRLLRDDGSVVWMEKVGYAFFDHKGEVDRAIGMVADITERKLGEEAVSTLSRRLIEAQEAERARIARDLHDDIGQRLALTLMALDQLQQPSSNSKAQVPGRMDEVRKQIVDISKSIHNLSHELHSATLRYLGIAKAIQGFCSEFSAQQKVDVNVACQDVPGTVTPEISLCLYRVLQEALHNAVKHSTVRRFEVELRGTSQGVSLTIRDSGIGFDPEKAMKGRGLGLISMQERLKLVNGDLSVESQPTRGTAIHARVPLAPANSSKRATR
jgi:PAS domain S-box-containing protein